MTTRIPTFAIVFLSLFGVSASNESDKLKSERPAEESVRLMLGNSVRGFFAENTGETVLESSTATYNVRREISARVSPGICVVSKL
jgi:hypothetical protein